MKIRYGVIGVGSMGREHILNLLALPAHEHPAEITAISDTHEPSIQNALALMPAGMPAPKVFTDHKALVQSGLCDAIIIATPNFTHIQLLRDILPHDVHVLVEKPLCTTIADCQEVVHLTKQRKKIVWVAQEYRYMPPVAEMIRIAQQGGVGKIHQIAIREHREPFYPKVGDWNRFSINTGGTLVEKCCHYFNLMEYIAQEKVANIFASGAQRVNHLSENYQGKTPDMLDSAYVVVEFPSGTRAHLDLCMFAENSTDNEQIVVVGDEGKLESLLPSLVLRHGRREDWGVRTAWGQPSGTGKGIATRRVWDTNIRYPGQHFGASYIEHIKFSQAIRQGLPAEINVEEGMRSVAIGLAAHKSINERRLVSLDEIIGG